MYNIKSEIRAWLWMLVLILVLQALPEPLPPKRCPQPGPGGQPALEDGSRVTPRRRRSTRTLR